MEIDSSPLVRVAVGAFTVEFIDADISEFVGSIPVVSSDDNYLSHGGGVSAAIWRAAGPDLRSDPAVLRVEAGERPRLADVLVSRIGVTGGYVLHGITIDFDSMESLDPGAVQLLYGNILDALLQRSLASVALPLMGTGAAGLTPEESIRGLAQAVAERGLLPYGVGVTLLSRDLDRAEVEEAFAGANARGRIAFLDGGPSDTAGAGAPLDLWRGLASHRSARVQQACADLDASTPETIAGAALALWSALTSADGEATAESRQNRNAHISRAHTARNRIAHSMGAADQRSVRELLRGCWELLNRTDVDPGSASGSLHPDSVAGRTGPEADPWLGPIADTGVDAWRGHAAAPRAGGQQGAPEPGRGTQPPASDRQVPPSTSPVADQLHGALLVPTTWNRRGTDHVRALDDLLHDILTDAEIDAEHRRLKRIGYRGDAQGCILESCVSEDPVEVLLRHFSGTRLTGLLEERGITPQPSEPAPRLAERLLHHLGFPVRDELIDPSSVLADVRRFGSEIHGLSEPDLIGRVARISRSMESVFRTYLRFLCLGVLKVAPDKWLRDRAGGGGAITSIDRATLGQLVWLVNEAGKDIGASGDNAVRELERELLETSSVKEWLPKKAYGLVQARNMWIHGGKDESVPLPEQRQQAKDFAALCDWTLWWLIDGPFPGVVLVEEISYDRWGRRRIRAHAADGTKEELFTDADLKPGEVYLMHTTTNPLRVDPLLVPMGAER